MGAQRDAEAPPVSVGAVAGARYDLGRHELGRADHGSGAAFVEEGDKAEVGEHGPALGGEQDVLGLEVTVDDLERVQLREREDGAARVELHRLCRQLGLVEQPRQVTAAVEGQHEPQPLGVVPRADEPHEVVRLRAATQVRLHEPQGLALALEAHVCGALLDAPDLGLGEGLDREERARDAVARQVDHAVAALAQLGPELEVLYLDAHFGLVGLLAHPEEVKGAQRRVPAAGLPAGHVAAGVARGVGGAGGQRDGEVLRRLQRRDGRTLYTGLQLQVGRVGFGEAPPQRGERRALVVGRRPRARRGRRLREQRAELAQVDERERRLGGVGEARDARRAVLREQRHRVARPHGRGLQRLDARLHLPGAHLSGPRRPAVRAHRLGRQDDVEGVECDVAREREVGVGHTQAEVR